MDDLISRQAAIDAIEHAKTARSQDGEIYVAKLNAEMNIQILPSAEPNLQPTCNQLATDTISRRAAIDALRYAELGCELEAIEALPSVERNYAQSIGKCETCYYWGNRIMMRDGSLGDCGNFGVSLSKEFYCAWWSQREREGEQDG